MYSRELTSAGVHLTAPKNLKLLDSLQLFLMLTGIAQFVYCLTITNYPFNAFLGGRVLLVL